MEDKKPIKPNGTLSGPDEEGIPVFWDLVDDSVRWMDVNLVDFLKMSELKKGGWVFEPLPSEAVKEIKPNHDTPFKWPDYWGYVVGDIDVSVGPTVCEDPFEKWLEEDMRTTSGDNVKHPSHYNQDGEIECIDAIKASLGLGGFAAYCRGNTMKYLWRYTYKNGLEDLHKAGQYLEWLIETEEEIESCSSQQ